MPDTYHPDLLLLATALVGRPVNIPRASRRFAKRLLRAAENHGVTQLLARRVREGSMLGFTDEDREALISSSRAQVAYDLMLCEATSKTLDLLKAADIPALLLIGNARCDSILRRYLSQNPLRHRYLHSANGQEPSRCRPIRRWLSDLGAWRAKILLQAILRHSSNRAGFRLVVRYPLENQ